MEENTFKKGIVDGLPICFGYFAVSFAFGIFATGNGLSILEAVLISMTNVTSAGQLAGVPIIVNGGTLIELALAQLVINSRYALMSISLSQKLDKDVNFFDKLLIGFINTDEVFAMSTTKKQDLSKYYMFGLIFTPYFGWTIGTMIGGIAGDVLPSIVSVSLQIAIYGMFIAIVVPEAKTNKNTLYCVIVSVIFALAFNYLPILRDISSGFRVIICGVASCIIMAIVAPIEQKEQ